MLIPRKMQSISIIDGKFIQEITFKPKENILIFGLWLTELKRCTGFSSWSMCTEQVSYVRAELWV
jgi:hypothetical protein